MALAGGTSLAMLLKHRLVEPERLVYLGGLTGLSAIDDGPDGLRLGAMATLRDLVTSEVVSSVAPVIARAADDVGNPRVRAVATVGGALAHADPRQDLPPVMLALDA